MQPVGEALAALVQLGCTSSRSRVVLDHRRQAVAVGVVLPEARGSCAAVVVVEAVEGRGAALQAPLDVVVHGAHGLAAAVATRLDVRAAVGELPVVRPRGGSRSPRWAGSLPSSMTLTNHDEKWRVTKVSPVASSSTGGSASRRPLACVVVEGHPREPSGMLRRDAHA